MVVARQSLERHPSGGYGFRLGKSLALAMVEKAYGEIGTEFEIVILGQRHKVRVIAESPFDPDNLALRA